MFENKVNLKTNNRLQYCRLGHVSHSKFQNIFPLLSLILASPTFLSSRKPIVGNESGIMSVLLIFTSPGTLACNVLKS